MIPRIAEKTLHRYARGFPVICITGPRQSGKTTLAKMAFPKKQYYSLEDPDIALLARSDPRGFLETWPDGLILDEAQYVPELFVYIKTAVDKDPKPGKYIITGSQQFNLMERISESLAGRAAFLTLLPFSLAELMASPNHQSLFKKTDLKESKDFSDPMDLPDPWDFSDPLGLMLKGFYPPLYDRDLSAQDFYAAYISSYVERDLRQLINIKDLGLFQNFIRFCAARNGGILNFSSLAADCGISHNTVKAWISVLEISGIIFLLRPYYKNFGKRLIKNPKLYFLDSGLVCKLLGIQTKEQLFLNPLRGGVFEGFIISELIKNRLNQGLNPQIWFWKDNSGKEIDCLLEDGENIMAIEIKSGKTFNKEMARGLEDWPKISGLSIKAGNRKLVYAGEQKSMINGIELVPWNGIVKIQ